MNQQMRNKNEEIKKAVWKLTPIQNYAPMQNYACGVCGKEPYYDNIKEYKFCPFCGKKMLYYEDISGDDLYNFDKKVVLPM